MLVIAETYHFIK